ncbi:hypothetical protein ACI3KS_04150 [Microbacterium sp. ZW T5_45]|uniref:DsrE family protein n=1 Tax=Microbacterium sp. ZW T5_45 TaxID=3378080 RepID=UPI00385539D6
MKTELTQKRHEVIVHVADNPEDVARATGAATAITQADRTLQVRIIVNGPALGGLLDSAPAVEVTDGVTIEACRVGLSRRGIDESQLQTPVSLVDSAAVAIVFAQRAGAAYVRL